MSKATKPNESESSSNYRISLTDIRGVGPATVEKLAKVGITSVEELHLCRDGRASTTQNRLRKQEVTIGKDTWDHLAAVGTAVHYSGSDRVKAKHLTGSITDDAQFRSSFIDISADDEPTTESEDNEPELPEYTTSELQSALDRIHDEYDDGYGEQVAFEADVSRFIGESEYDVSIPQGIISSVMRYRHNAERVEAQGDYQAEYGSILVLFSETL